MSLSVIFNENNMDKSWLFQDKYVTLHGHKKLQVKRQLTIL